MKIYRVHVVVISNIFNFYHSLPYSLNKFFRIKLRKHLKKKNFKNNGNI